MQTCVPLSVCRPNEVRSADFLFRLNLHLSYMLPTVRISGTSTILGRLTSLYLPGLIEWVTMEATVAILSCNDSMNSCLDCLFIPVQIPKPELQKCLRPDCEWKEVSDIYVIEKVVGRTVAISRGKPQAYWLVKWEGCVTYFISPNKLC